MRGPSNIVTDAMAPRENGPIAVPSSRRFDLVIMLSDPSATLFNNAYPSPESVGPGDSPPNRVGAEVEYEVPSLLSVEGQAVPEAENYGLLYDLLVNREGDFLRASKRMLMGGVVLLVLGFVDILFMPQPFSLLGLVPIAIGALLMILALLRRPKGLTGLSKVNWPLYVCAVGGEGRCLGFDGTTVRWKFQTRSGSISEGVLTSQMDGLPPAIGVFEDEVAAVRSLAQMGASMETARNEESVVPPLVLDRVMALAVESKEVRSNVLFGEDLVAYQLRAAQIGSRLQRCRSSREYVNKAKVRLNGQIDSYQATLRSIYEAEADKVAGLQAAFAAEVSALPSFFVEVITDMAGDIEQDLGMIAVVSGRESEMAMDRMRTSMAAIASSLDSLKGRVLQERLLIQKRNRLRDASLEVIEALEGDISVARDGVLKVEIAPSASPYRGQSIDLAQDIRGDMMRRYSAERGFGVFLEQGMAAPHLLGGEASSDPGFRAWSMEGLDQMEVAIRDALVLLENEVAKQILAMDASLARVKAELGLLADDMERIVSEVLLSIRRLMEETKAWVARSDVSRKDDVRRVRASLERVMASRDAMLRSVMESSDLLVQEMRRHLRPLGERAAVLERERLRLNNLLDDTVLACGEYEQAIGTRMVVAQRSGRFLVPYVVFVYEGRWHIYSPSEMGPEATLSPRVAELLPPIEEMMAALRSGPPAAVDRSLLSGSKQARKALAAKRQLKGMDAFLVDLIARRMSKNG